MCHKRADVTPWWLTDGSNRVIDLTLGPEDRRQLKADPSAR